MIVADKRRVTGVPPCGSAAGFALGSGQTLSTLRLRKSHLIKRKNICHERSADSRRKWDGDEVELPELGALKYLFIHSFFFLT